MKLIDDAKSTWHRLWSVRLNLLAVVICAVDTALPWVAPESGRSVRFAILTGVVSAAAAFARLVTQPKLHAGKGDE
jgi:hypothetical protein